MFLHGPCGSGTDWAGLGGSLLGLEVFYSLIWVLVAGMHKYVQIHHVVLLKTCVLFLKIEF